MYIILIDLPPEIHDKIIFSVLCSFSILFFFQFTKVSSLHFLPSDFGTKGYSPPKLLFDVVVPSVFDWAVFAKPKRKPPPVRPPAPKKRYDVFFN